MAIDAILVTGHVASGRSTLLRQLLAELGRGSRCAVCVHRHARAFGLETSLLPVETLPCVHYSEVFDFGSGCLCCSPDGDLSRLLNDLSSRQDELKLTHLLIETTGVADPKPFIKLFDNERYAQHFTLRSVLCVADLLRVQSLLESKDMGDQSAGSRGRVQLQCSDTLILNHADEVPEHAESIVSSTKQMLLSIAMEGESPSRPSVLGPCSFCQLGKSLLASIAAASRRRMLPTTCDVLPTPSMFQLRFGPGVHDAACSNCCWVRPRGGLVLDSVLAMLQLLLDSGEAYRIQGYLSFLPKKFEPRASMDSLGANVFPPPVERLWAMPMVVVEGHYRGRLKIFPVLHAETAGATLAEAEASNRPFQETAFDAAASDRGGCKIFLCGPSLDEAQVKAQFKRCLAGPGSFDFVCNLEEASPEAAQALDHMEQKVMEAMQKGILKDSRKEEGDARSSAERFADCLAAELKGAISDAAPQLGPHRRSSARLRPQRGRSVAETVEVRWQDGVVSVSARETAKPLMEVPQDGNGPGYRDVTGLRFCVDGPSYETLVLGSDIYCRPSASI